MVIAVHTPGDVMYLIKDPERKGFLTWNFQGIIYLMAFTSSDKAEEYNAIVLEHRPGDVVIVERRESMNLAKLMVERGVLFMIIDYPPVNDQEFWDKPLFRDGVPVELGRNYSIVDFKKVLGRS